MILKKHWKVTITTFLKFYWATVSLILFYTDKRTVFEYTKKDTPFDDKDTFTQFSYAYHQLGVDIKTTSVPQAKGRIERADQIFQSLLPDELRRAHVSGIDQANAFLSQYLSKFNDKFSMQLNSAKNVYEKQPKDALINHTLGILSPRIIDTAHCIKYKKQSLHPN